MAKQTKNTKTAKQTISPKLEKRLKILKAVISGRDVDKKIEKAFNEAKGNWPDIIVNLKKAKVGVKNLEKIDFANDLMNATYENDYLVKKLIKLEGTNSLKDIALSQNKETIIKLIDTKNIPEAVSGKSIKERKENFAQMVDNKVYAKDPSNRLRQMVFSKELPFKSKNIKDGLNTFFKNLPDFNVCTTSVYHAIKEEKAFKEIANDDQDELIKQLKVFQRIQAISPTPESVYTLMNSNLNSAYQVAEIPEKQFIQYYNKKANVSELEKELQTAKKVYSLAVNSKIRNEQALMTFHEVSRGVKFYSMGHYAQAPSIPPYAGDDGEDTPQQIADKNNIPLNWENLFGSVDLCECDECNSVLSPAAYFVELLQYLRNNNLDTEYPNTGEKGIKDTAVEQLFKRRPDLGCLELTCKNTNTVLPYVDLVNEVMESFVVHLNEYINDINDPKQARLDVYNIEDEITSELMAQPQHTNYHAYCILKNAKYPFTLPYHQPIDAQGIFLNYLDTSRYELMKTFRSQPDIDPEHPKFNELVSLHNIALDRAVDAEYLGMTQEEYIILTKEAYWQKQYFDIKHDKVHTEDEYREKIGLEEIHKYYGYEAEEEMLSANETDQVGLTFVKKQFLKRTGTLYTELVELLKTQFINPNYPKGLSLKIMESLRLSYRYMQTLVDTSSNDPKVRYGKLLPFLEKWQAIIPLYEEMIYSNICKPAEIDLCVEKKNFKKWVYCCFEKLGKLIILESGGGPYLPIVGDIIIFSKPAKKIGSLSKDGMVRGLENQIIGHVSVNGKVVDLNDQPLVNKFKVNSIGIINNDGEIIGVIDINEIRDQNKEIVNWVLAEDSCDLTKVRLKHLDGTELNSCEWDKIHRYIRLWRKLDWTIDETDKAITGLAAYPIDVEDDMFKPDDCFSSRFDSFDFEGECDEKEESFDCQQEKLIQVEYKITPEFLNQLVAVKKLLDKTGLELIKLLTFWTEISTAGNRSLYKRLFLTHNLLNIDSVFKANENGNYLAKSASISDHLSVLMAALNLKSEDISILIDSLSIPDELTIQNVSILYRFRLLAKVLGIKIPELIKVQQLFGNTFQNAHFTLSFLNTWEKLENSGLSFRELNYIIKNDDDKDKPLHPDKKSMLLLAKTVYDGLIALNNVHTDISDDEEPDVELIRLKSALLFDLQTTEQIINLLQGNTVYTTNAPKDLVSNIVDFDSNLSETLKTKLSYNFIQGYIQVTGILTDSEENEAKALFDDTEWVKTFDRVKKQALVFFRDILLAVFSDGDEAVQILLQGDINIPAEQQDPDNPVENTSPKKRLFFLKHFIPFLRKRLVHQFILDNLSNALGVEKELTDVLISEVLKDGDPLRTLIKIFEEINKHIPSDEDEWKGYLIPASEDDYIFVVRSDNQPKPIKIDDQNFNLHQQEDPSNIYLSDPVRLKAGQAYLFELEGLTSDLKDLFWKTPLSPKSSIPDSVLLPDYSSKLTENAFIKLQKAVLLLNSLNITGDDVLYLENHKDDFDQIDFNAFTLVHWKRLEAFARLQKSLPKTDSRLIDFFELVNKATENTELINKLSEITNWETESIEKLICAEHFNIHSTDEFKNEKNILKLQKAMYVADKINMDIDNIFDWAKPEFGFWECHVIAESIRKSLKARYEQEDWEKVVKPLNDQLRMNQRNALINYLLVQDILVDWGVIDADSLFEFFLIDVQMESCMETSRIKQAISSVQLFIQRCMLGEEEKRGGVPKKVLDRDRWEWMQRHRVWEANRKVFLFPENWIEPELRDDKSPFFKEMESELLQKDINNETVTNALKTYLYKVDEVANMQVVGLHVEEEIQEDENGPVQIKLHVFSRTRNAPYFFYYRYYDIQEKNWYPWEKMQVDIPSYDVENDEGVITGNGCYLIPVIWNKRLLIFFPQFMKKTKPNPLSQGESLNTLGNEGDGITKLKPIEYWEIKLAWSEYRNNRWTQKQVSQKAINSGGDSLPELSAYFIVPAVSWDYQKILIIVFEDKSNYACGNFEFAGNKINSTNTPYYISGTIPDYNFHYYDSTNKIETLQTNELPGSNYLLIQNFGYSFSLPNFLSSKFNEYTDFHHPFTKEIVGRLNSNSLPYFFEYNLNIDNKKQAFGAFSLPESKGFNELKMPYSIYNWELFFHTPTVLANQLSKSQEFEEAMKWFHYVFNPYVEADEVNKYWRFFPFQKTSTENILESLFKSLEPNQSNEQINEWRDKPFSPHVVARSRPIAYMKWVVMKYLDNLIEWADYLYRQYTIETLNQATQLYVLASHILGSKPQIIPKRGKIKPQSYLSLLDKWDAFSNAMVEMEIVFPYSNQTPFPVGISNGTVGFTNIFGFGSTLYFCIPDNPKLLEYWKTIEQRLYQIRHCQTIEGIFRIPALWDPPIDPALLVQATAQGLSISSVLSDLNSPMPNYRFTYLIQKALELCNELKSLGNSLLSVLEKKDAEALSKMRSRHETGILNLVMEIKKLQLEESNEALKNLKYNRKSPVYRLKHYLKLIGEDLKKVPGNDKDFSEIVNIIEKPKSVKGLKLSAYEKEEMDKSNEAKDKQADVGKKEFLASLLHLIPTAGIEGQPLGVGVSVQFGGPFLGGAMQAWAKYLQNDANEISYKATNAGKKGGLQKQLQERVFQANSAGYEIKNIDKQITSQEIRIEMANQEITNQQKQMDNANEVEEFLKNKYTNEELYSWMLGSVKTLYYQVYKMAYDLSKKAEKVYQFERGLDTSNFIQFGYWDASRDGLHAGESLYVGLKQLEVAYQEKRGHDYEITKHISLRQVNPLALLELKEKGKCEFILPEVLFDMDYPGHFMCRIKSVALSIPCIVGPYTSVNCTARLLENKYRISSIAKDKNDYKEKIEETADDRFRTVNIPITAIAASSGQNDSGVFELNFRDERFMPFEGAGTISKWRLELPEEFRQFDYETITDIVMHIRYTSLEGGDRLKNAAAGSLNDYVKSTEELSQQEGLFSIFDLKNDFSSEWQKFSQIPQNGIQRTLTLANLNELLPVFTKNKQADKIKANDVILLTETDIQAASLILTRGQNDNNFTLGPKTGKLNSFVLHDADLQIDNWILRFNDAQIIIDKMWMVVRYVLK